MCILASYFPGYEQREDLEWTKTMFVYEWNRNKHNNHNNNYSSAAKVVKRPSLVCGVVMQVQSLTNITASTIIHRLSSNASIDESTNINPSTIIHE